MGDGRLSFRTTAFHPNSGRRGASQVKESSLKAAATFLVLCVLLATSLTADRAQTAAAAQTGPPAQLQPAQQPQQLKITEYRLPPDKHSKAEALYKTRTVLYLFGLVFGV